MKAILKWKRVGWAHVRQGEQVWLEGANATYDGPYNVEDPKTRVLRHARGLKAFPEGQLWQPVYADEEE